MLQEAIWQERKVRVTYERPATAPGERLVDPLGLVARESVWYLVGAVKGRARVYRVARIHDAAITDEPSVRPEGFDLAEYWAQPSADFVRFGTNIEVLDPPDLRRRIGRTATEVAALYTIRTPFSGRSDYQ